MTASVLGIFKSFIPGLRLVDGGELNQMANRLFGYQNGLTALAGGGADGAPLLLVGYNEVTVCATASDSVLLPPAVPGAIVWVENGTAETLAVFAQTVNTANDGSADMIRGAATNADAASVTQATTLLACYVCSKLGVWKQAISG